MARIKLHDICHARSGDKRDTLNIGLICYDRKHFELIRNEVTAERVKKFFCGSCKGDVERFELPGIAALNFVLYEALDGGSSRTLTMDCCGKTPSSLLLEMQIEASEGVTPPETPTGP